MNATTEQEFKVGDIVKYAVPMADENPNDRFVVAEYIPASGPSKYCPNGQPAEVTIVAICDLPIKPRYYAKASDVVRV